jgi:sugar phosphate isomerase/epimerase
MLQSNSRPVLGAAMPVDAIEQHREWLLEHQRDIEIQTFHMAEVLESDWQGIAAHARKALDGHTGRRGIHGPFWGFKIDSQDPDIRAVVRKRLLQGLDVCAAVGANQMVIHSPFTTWDYNNLDAFKGARQSLFDRVHETLRAAVARAEDMGCVLVIENIEDKNPHDRVELARSFNSPSVKVSIDTGHAHYAYGSTGAPPVDYYVTAAADMLQHVHLQDADGYADRHWLPGEGTIRWASVFSALAKLEEMPRLMIEVKDIPGLQRGAEWLSAQGLAI